MAKNRENREIYYLQNLISLMYLIIVLGRGVLSAKLVLRYKHIFGAIL